MKPGVSRLLDERIDRYLRISRGNERAEEQLLRTTTRTLLRIELPSCDQSIGPVLRSSDPKIQRQQHFGRGATKS
jgi:hypothetical protein